MSIFSAFAITTSNYGYIEATGGTVTISGSYKIHTFDTVGTSSFTVTKLGVSNKVETLIVAGGGAGGNGPFDLQYGSGGGGAGGLIYTSGSIVTLGTYNVIVGAGGIPSTVSFTPGGNGGNSSFNGLISLGGGGGAYEYPASDGNGNNGGSGGGGTGPGSGSLGIGGLGLQPSQSGDSGLYGYGNNAKSGNGGTGNGGGGGGAGVLPTSSVGGDGLQFNFISASYYAGGGAGGAAGLGIAVSGGLGGGGYIDSNGVPYPGTNGTGGGGAGVNAQISDNGESGGSGIVMIKYQYQN
jgi:hypothetical protein